MAPALMFTCLPRFVAAIVVIGTDTVPGANLADTITGMVAIRPSVTLGFTLVVFTTLQIADPQKIENPAAIQAGANDGAPSVIPLGKLTENWIAATPFPADPDRLILSLALPPALTEAGPVSLRTGATWATAIQATDRKSSGFNCHGIDAYDFIPRSRKKNRPRQNR
jgi:hypothetical protein